MINIRHARKDEANSLQKLNHEVFIDNQNYDEDVEIGWSLLQKGKEYFTQLLNNSIILCLIAEDEGKLVGYASANPKTFVHCKSKYLEIENIGVIPGYRSKGIGLKLLQACEAWARSKGFQKIYLDSYIKNINAIKFYKKHGFYEIALSLEKNI